MNTHTHNKHKNPNTAEKKHTHTLLSFFQLLKQMSTVSLIHQANVTHFLLTVNTLSLLLLGNSIQRNINTYCNFQPEPSPHFPLHPHHILPPLNGNGGRQKRSGDKGCVHVCVNVCAF